MEKRIALYTVLYNWIRTRKAHRVTPWRRGLTDKLMDLADAARLIDDAEMRLIKNGLPLLSFRQSK